MKIVVIGGSGLVGTKLMNKLRQWQHEVVVTSVDTLTGEGAAEALMGARVVVDVTNALSVENAVTSDFSEASYRDLLAAEAAAGVGHHLALSIVGAEHLSERDEFRAKMTQENLIKVSKIPYTILRSAQFFESINSIIQSRADGEVVRLPPTFLQPVALGDVAAALADLVVGAPANGIVEVTGPELYRLDALAREIMAINEDRRQVVEDADARSGDSPLPPCDHQRFAPTRFEDWLSRSLNDVPADRPNIAGLVANAAANPERI